MVGLDRIPVYHRLSPLTQSYVKRAVGIGMTLYLSKTLLTSKQFRRILARFNMLSRRYSSEKSGGGDQLAPSGLSPILDMPAKERHKIWEYVSQADLKTLRLVCHAFKMDIDGTVGICTTIDSRFEDQFQWITRTAVQSCLVTHLHDVSNWDFLIKPKRLREMEVNEPCTINPEIFGQLIRRFSNLEQLSVYFKEEGWSTAVRNKEIFRHLDYSDQDMYAVRVTYCRETRTTLWGFNFTKRKKVRSLSSLINEELNLDAVHTPASIKYLYLNFEHYSGLDGVNYAQNRLFWKNLLDKQRYLVYLYCDFGPTCWDIFSQAIKRNSSTIQEIFLFNVNRFDVWSSRYEVEEPFDWNLFASCKRLTKLTIKAEARPQVGPIVYKPMEPGVMNLRVLLCDFGIMFWRFYSSIIEANPGLFHIELHRLSSFDRATNSSSPLDLALFQKCPKLVRLILVGESLAYMSITNFDTLSSELRGFYLNWSILAKEDLLFFARNMSPRLSTKWLDGCIVHGYDDCPRAFVQQHRYGGTDSDQKRNLRVVYDPFEAHWLSLLGTVWLIFC